MKQWIRNGFLVWLVGLLGSRCAAALADDGVFTAQNYEQLKPSLVAVKYTWDNELKPEELTAAGIVVSDDGLVMIPIQIVTPLLVPDGQMKDFKIIVPSDTSDEQEIDATLEGRDERSGLAFIRAKTPQKWTAVKFVDSSATIGDRVYSIGILPKTFGYEAFMTAATVSAHLRGPLPQVLVDGDLAGIGSPVFDSKGEAIGYVSMQGGNGPLLDNPSGATSEIPSAIYRPAKTFVPASDFIRSLQDPPTEDSPLILPWAGLPQLKGLDKDLAEFMGLTDTPALQISDVATGSPADRAGLKTLDIILKVNGQPLERGSEPSDLPSMLQRKIQWMKVGDKVTFTVIHQKGDTPRDVEVVLEPRPKQWYTANRYYAKDLGFVARDVVFLDTYYRNLSQTTGGVAVAMVRPAGPAAEAKLAINDMVTQMNGKPVTDLDEFKKDYEDFRRSQPHDPVVLVISQTDGKEETIDIEAPQDLGGP